MRTNLSAMLAIAVLGTVGSVQAGISGGGAALEVREEPTLLVIGPIESIDVKHGVAVVLGQTVLARGVETLSVGLTASVVGTMGADGAISATLIKTQGLYVAGATNVLLSGKVQKADSSIGVATVGGLRVDLTGLMSSNFTLPGIGARVQVSGTQPNQHGVVLAQGISGGGFSSAGISGGGITSKGISGGGFSAAGISGGGITSKGISGGGFSTAGISGGGFTSKGISGGGFSTAGISGGGFTSKGISGGGITSKGISGGGFSTAGISGGGFGSH